MRVWGRGRATQIISCSYHHACHVIIMPCEGMYFKEEVAVEYEIELQPQRDRQLVQHLLALVEARKLVELGHLAAQRRGDLLAQEELVDVVALLLLERRRCAHLSERCGEGADHIPVARRSRDVWRGRQRLYVWVTGDTT
jgi:hypothetical protein